MPFNVEAMVLNAQANTENEQVKASSARIFTWPKLKAPAWGLASAATVLLAVGFWTNLTPTTAEINTKLLSGLEKSPSGTVININSELKIELMASYQNQQGVVCRSMLEHSPQSSNPAMACFVKGQWQLERKETGEGYQTASSTKFEKEGLMTATQEQAWLNEKKKH